MQSLDLTFEMRRADVRATVDATTAMLQQSRCEVAEQIAGTREIIKRSRELMDRIERELARR